MTRSQKLFAAALVVLFTSAIASAKFPTSHPYPGFSYSLQTKNSPPQTIYVAAVDLTAPNVQVRVARGGADPDGDGPWQTTLIPPTQIAEREHFDLVINGDFFSHKNGADAEGVAAQRAFQAGAMARASGTAVTDGVTWSVAKSPRPALVIDSAQHPRIDKMTDPPAGANQVVGGSHILVQDGNNVAPPPTNYVSRVHPRTAIGIADHGKTLLLVVVDGRRADTAVGMTLQELADLLIENGAEQALNLDGGGSSCFAMRNPATHKMEILNQPSDGRERPVADVVGVRFTASPATRPSH